jgi:hypothetical protein
MSRSYKKNPGFTDSRPHNYYKRLASKKARRVRELPNGSGYKKAVGYQYDICDFKFIYWNKQDIGHRYCPIYKLYMK